MDTRNEQMDDCPISPTRSRAEVADYLSRHDQGLAFEREINIPEGFRNHTGLYALPPKLVERLVRHVPELFGEYREFESSFSGWAADRRLAGFWYGRPVPLGLLEVEDGRVSLEDAERYQWMWPEKTIEQVKLMLEGVHEKSWDNLVTQQRAYAGWLNTNPQYLEELAQLRPDLERVLATGQIMPPVLWLDDHNQLHEHRAPYPEDLLARYEAFCVRWCLTRLITFDLPEPQSALVPSGLGFIPRKLGQMGLSFFVPMTLKPWGDMISRGMISAMQKMDVADFSIDEPDRWHHLSEWVNLDAKSSMQGQKYSVLYRLWFYWRIIEQRHGLRMARRLGKIQRALGEFLYGEPGPGGNESAMARKLLGEAQKRLKPQ